MFHKKKTSVHLFGGIGGGALADIQNGIEPVAFCEFDQEARLVEALRFPGRPIFPDVRTLTGKEIIEALGYVPWRLSGGSPCQDLSVNGKKAGFEGGEKSSLVFHQMRLLQELGCEEMFWENVTGALGDRHRDGLLKFFKMIRDAGYGAAYCTLSSGHFGANHERDRVWLLARKGFDGIHEVTTSPIPARKYYHTPVAADCLDAHNPMPANYRRNSPQLPSMIWMPQLGEHSTMDEIRAMVKDHRLNPQYVEQMQAFPPEWTNLNMPYTVDDIRLNLGNTWKYPAPYLTKQRPYEYPKSVPVGDAELPLWRARIRQLGNCQDRIVCAAADRILTEYMDGCRTLF